MIDNAYRIYATYGFADVFLFTWRGTKEDGIKRGKYESHLRGMDDWDDIIAKPVLLSRR